MEDLQYLPVFFPKASTKAAGEIKTLFLKCSEKQKASLITWRPHFNLILDPGWLRGCLFETAYCIAKIFIQVRKGTSEAIIFWWSNEWYGSEPHLFTFQKSTLFGLQQTSGFFRMQILNGILNLTHMDKGEIYQVNYRCLSV